MARAVPPFPGWPSPERLRAASWTPLDLPEPHEYVWAEDARWFDCPGCESAITLDGLGARVRCRCGRVYRLAARVEAALVDEGGGATVAPDDD